MTVIFLIFMSVWAQCYGSYHEQYRVPQTCTDQWESYIFADKEYIIQNLHLRWEDAKILCRGHHNGSLAIIDTAAKADFLAEALAESQFALESVWVGARRASSDDPAGYRWPDATPLRRSASDVFPGDAPPTERHFPMWINRTHVPVPEGGADCVAMDRINHDVPVYLDLPCPLQRPFVCERESHPTVPVSELKLVRCRSGFYHVYNAHLTWDQAAAYCVLRKMTLANISTMRCLKKLGMTMLKTRPSIESAWVGARGELGEWKWIDTELSIFLPAPNLDTEPAVWPPLRDRSSMKQDGCLLLDRHATHAPVLMEARCDRRMQFICYEDRSISTDFRRSSPVPPSDDNFYYVLVWQKLYWQHAFENCYKMNGSLARIESNDVLVQLLLVMGENKDNPVDHIWVSGRLNVTKDVNSDTVSYIWYNPLSGRRIPDKRSFEDAAASGLYMPPWLDEEFTVDSPCLNLDRQNHLNGLVYGLPCDTPQYSICMIEKTMARTIIQEAPVQTISSTTQEAINEVVPEV